MHDRTESQRAEMQRNHDAAISGNEYRKLMKRRQFESAVFGGDYELPTPPTLEQTQNFISIAHNATENARERVLMRKQDRLETAQTKAVELSAPAEGGAVYDPDTYYLIHVPKASTRLEELEQEIDLLPDRLLRAAENKRRTNLMAQYLWEIDNAMAQRLASCNTWKWFRHWLETGECRMVAAKCCHQDKLCPVCANLRAGRTASRYNNQFLAIMAENPLLVMYMWTFTVKDGPILTERLLHLKNANRIMTDHRRKVRSGTSRNTWMPFCGVAGGVYSMEITIGKNSGMWHPHTHMLTLMDTPPELDGTRCRAMEQWWLERTGDSFVIDCRPISLEQQAGAIIEVLKYACKFSSMTLQQNYEAWKATRGMQLMRSFGCVRGIPTVTNLMDDMSNDEGEFIDLGFKYDNGQYRAVTSNTTIEYQDQKPITCGDSEAVIDVAQASPLEV